MSGPPLGPIANSYNCSRTFWDPGQLLKIRDRPGDSGTIVVWLAHLLVDVCDTPFCHRMCLFNDMYSYGVAMDNQY